MPSSLLAIASLSSKSFLDLSENGLAGFQLCVCVRTCAKVLRHQGGLQDWGLN
jgi:hypothetical protein